MYHMTISIMRVGVDLGPHVMMALLQWVQHTQQNEGTGPAQICCCDFISA